MRKYLCFLALPMLLVGCGGSNNDGDDNEILIQQFDRVGRPTVTTVLIRSELKDTYNQALDMTTWPELFQAHIQASLEFTDLLDGIAGNALGGDSAALAGELVQDRLVIDTSVPDCDAILAVELGIAGNCGGRTLERDVVDDLLTALVGTPTSDNVPLDSAFLHGFPFLAPPNGRQIDRQGRPLINTALIAANIKDAYNAAEIPPTWASLFNDDITAGLVFLDSLDGVPINAPLNDPAALADIIVEDVLIIDTSIPNCNAFLAVEMNDPNNCGGRTLEMDVIDDIVSVLVGGPISDGVGNDNAFLLGFPFLGPPN